MEKCLRAFSEMYFFYLGLLKNFKFLEMLDFFTENGFDKKIKDCGELLVCSHLDASSSHFDKLINIQNGCSAHWKSIRGHWANIQFD